MAERLSEMPRRLENAAREVSRQLDFLDPCHRASNKGLSPDMSMSSIPPYKAGGIPSCGRYLSFRYMSEKKYRRLLRERYSESDIAIEAKKEVKGSSKKEPQYITVNGRQQGIMIARSFFRDTETERSEVENEGMKKIFFLTIYTERGQKRVICRQYLGAPYEARTLQEVQALILERFGAKPKQAGKKEKINKKPKITK